MMNAIVKCLEKLCELTDANTWRNHVKKWKEWAVGTTDGGVKDSFIGKWATAAQNQNAAKLAAFKEFSKPAPKWQSPNPALYSGVAG